ncbi:LasR-specific antiactivator QslA [Pseudomonas gregormendelii]
MIERGVQCAQAWLDTSGEIPLWWELAQTRKTFPVGDCQDAFEAGFLLSIQQRLGGARGHSLLAAESMCIGTVTRTAI